MLVYVFGLFIVIIVACKVNISYILVCLQTINIPNLL